MGKVAVLASTATGAAWSSDEIRISGTGSGVGGLQRVATAFVRDQARYKVSVMPAIGSAGGIRALAAGRLDLAVSNRAPDRTESAAVPMSSLEYARTPFVVAVHANLGVQQLTTAQLAALFEPGATFPNGQRARAVLRLSDATDTRLLKAFSPDVERALIAAEARRGMLDAATDSDAAELVQTTPGAFAASTLAQILSEGRPFVALTIDGRAPTVDNLAQGRYPHFKSLFAVSRSEPTAGVAAFLAYLRSDAARALLRSHGHLPL